MAIPTAKKPSHPNASLLAQLEKDAGLEHLASSLQLNEGFELALLICSSRHVARAALRILRDRLSSSGEEPTHFEILDPYKTRTDPTQPLDIEAALQAVLVPLVSEANRLRDSSGRTIVVLDATLAYERDEPAWRHLFRKLNEGRNIIIERLQVPLLVCMPEFLEPIFAHEAPDFWSVRSLVVPLTVQLEPLAVARLDAITLVLRAAALLEEPTSSELANDNLKEELTRARTAVAASPDDDVANESLAIQLDRTAQTERAKGNLKNALAARREAIATRRQLASKAERADWILALVTALDGAGFMSLELDDLQGARAAVKEAVDVARKRLPMLVPVPLVALAAVENEAGDPESSLAALEEAIPLIRSLPADRTTVLDLLAWALTLYGRNCRKRGDLSRALSALEEALRIRQEILGPRHQKTVVVMEDLAKLHMVRSDLSQSRRIWEDVFDRRKELFGIDHRETWLSMLGLAATLRLQGDLQPAREFANRVLENQKRILGPNDLATRATEQFVATLLENESADADLNPT